MDELDKLLLDPGNFIHDSIDLQHMPLEDVFEQLRISGAGLSSADAEARLQLFGLNKLKEKSENKFLKYLSFMWNPLSWVMEAAAVMAIVLADGGVSCLRSFHFSLISYCLFLTQVEDHLVIVSSRKTMPEMILEENNAGNAAAALMARLAPKCKVLRDAQWQDKDAAVLVPGDIISIKLGDIIPADARLLEGDPLKVDQADPSITSPLLSLSCSLDPWKCEDCFVVVMQSALTGESFSVTKMRGDLVFSGSICKQGEIEAVVIATGIHSFFGKAALLVDSIEVVGHFQKVLTSIGNFCICSIAVGIIIEIVVMFLIQHRSYRNGINNLLVLLIGGIPIAMPTVLSVTLAIGSHRLSQQGAITKRMTAIEELAGMDVLCSDKTGTLTLNRLTVDRNLIEVFSEDMNKDTVILLAARAARLENQDAIDTAIVNMLADPKEARSNITEMHFFPFNPVDKRTAITYMDLDGNWYRASKGAPEQILNLCHNKEKIVGKVHAIIDKFAERGLCSLGVAFQAFPEKTRGPRRSMGLLRLIAIV
ncbi:hypothetical protein ZIOFF_029622 [Zingiber officinale]|uniref:P-type H(+)-exporting transporter n=1 Tax=Zingiber officinale TaxID=94328 RepID=A0A8J5GYG2_ZINOF|nr:hypothetical protein ZIOFF_029622 [Zingiber officinale]